MIRDRHLLLIILSCILFLPVRAQSYSAQQIELAERLHSLAKNAAPELAYIQTSKDIYETGEDLWFKVYILDAQYLIPSDLSETLYLQMINEENKKIVWQEKYEIQDGFAYGRVYLDSNLPPGGYILAAYTSNSFFKDSSEFKAVRRIKVVTDITSVHKYSDETLTVPFIYDKKLIQFSTFPESGNLISGIQSNLAFKAVNINGEPVDISGTLFEDTTPIMKFKSTHAGMGRLNFTPDKNKKYLIRLTEPAIDSSFLLPEIYSAGIALQLVTRNQESLNFKVTQSPSLGQEDIYLRVQCRGEVYGMTMGKLKGELLIKVPLSELPQGIAEVTLFNSSLVPVAERLVYVNYDKKLNITARLSDEVFPTRGKAMINILVKDENGKPVVANLGVSVFDKLYQNPRDSNNILSHFYLTEQLKGRIYDPSFYFNSKSKGRDEALDLLMLTQGWRKYVWNEMNLKRFDKERQQIISDGIKGELYYGSRKKKIPKEQAFVMAFSPNKDSLNTLIPADSEGVFTVPPYHFKKWENDYVYLKPLGSYGSKPSYKITNPVTPQYDLHIKLTDPFETFSHQMKANEINYPVPGLRSEKEEISEFAIRDEVIKIPGVTIKGQKGNTIRGKFMGTLDSLTKYDLLNDYVCLYDILNCPNHKRGEYGSRKPIPGHWYYQIIGYGTPGMMMMRVVYYPPRFTEDELLKMSNLSRVKAYYGNCEFYKPNYDKESEADTLPDFRNTLLWEPSVITNEKGEATLSFFCSDINTDFVGRIEGVGGEGLLGTGNFKFTVRKLKLIPENGHN